MIRPKRVILVHKGALGDFLQVWPSLVSLSRFWGEETELFWAGREQYSLWTSPLGIKRCPGKLIREVDSLYTATVWPQGLKDCQVIWFGLRLYPLEEHFPNVWFVPGLAQGVRRPPREVYAEGLAALGIPFCTEWPDVWRETITGSLPREKDDRVLLFPGAGHRKRCWPLEKFAALGAWLREWGKRVGFVYGPAELERGFPVQKLEPIVPEDLSALQGLLFRASLVVGNDSGPMHLAGYLGVPTLALFGPAAPEQWGPYRARTLTSSLPCSPCTDTGVITCTSPLCMQELPLEWVQEAILRLQTDEIRKQG